MPVVSDRSGTAAESMVMLVVLTHNCSRIDRRRSTCAMASEPNTAAGRTGCSRHRRWRSVRRYDANRSARPLPLRMDLWTKSRLRLLFGVIGRTAVQRSRPRGGDPELPVAGGPRDRIHRISRTHLGQAHVTAQCHGSSFDPLCAAYVVVLVLGLRKGEVLGLSWKAPSISRRAHVCPTISSSESGGPSL
jgi:hypothetical protein